MQRPELTVRRKFRWWILVTVCALVVANIGVYWAIGFYAARELRQINDEIRAAGYPVTIEELDRYYDPGPGSAETGQEIVRAFHKLNGKPVGKQDPLFLSGKHPEPGDVLDETAIAATRAFVEQNNEALVEIASLVESGKAVRYPIDFHAVLDGKPAYYDQIRSAIRLLSMDALLAGLDGTPQRAADRICVAYLLADLLREEPALLSQLVRGACLDIVTKSLEVILNRASLAQEQLLKIQQTIDAIQLGEAIPHGLIGERCVFIIGLETRPGYQTTEFIDLFFRFRNYRRLECISLEKSFDAWIDIGKLPPWERMKAVYQFQATADSKSAFTHTGTKVLGPAIARSYGATGRYMAQLSTASTAITAIRFTRDRGRVPASLADLVPGYMNDVPLDPFDGNPLRYVQRDEGFVVYALGEDCDDDGGNPPAKNESLRTAGDVVFRMINP